MPKKKKNEYPQYYLYSQGAQKKTQHQKQELESLRKKGDPRQNAGTSRA